MEGILYYVELEGRTVGPYDRRTIVGMRIKKALTGEHVVIGPTGARITVADLIRTPGDFNPTRTSVSVVLATFTCGLAEVEGGSIAIPGFRGEVEARVQKDVIRLAGRFRQGLGWKEDRVKIPLAQVIHARLRGSLVDLWLRADKGKLQRVTLELFSPQSAGEFAGWLPDATPYPGADSAAPAAGAESRLPIGMVVAVLGVVLTVGLVLAALLLRRLY